jgi:hypothetical protein
MTPLELHKLNTRQISELIKETPSCGHFYENYCEWTSARLGRIFGTSKAFCNLECRKFGPYSGKNFSNENQIKFLQNAWVITNPTGGKEFANKVLRHHYQMPVDIEIPDSYAGIKRSLSFLDNKSGYLGFYLTGSVIIKTATKPPKDYDIVLKFDSIKSILNANLNDNLPKNIDGIKTDYFYYIGDNPEVYFACMDVEKKILYTSPWFDLKIRDIDKEIKIVSVDSKFKSILSFVLSV